MPYDSEFRRVTKRLERIEIMVGVSLLLVIGLALKAFGLLA